MSNQINFSEVEYRIKRKKTQKERFLERMESIVPLERWCGIIRPHYYENGNGRQPIPLATMLRMYLVSLWYNLSDAQAEDLIIENMAVRNYVGVSGEAPDETTLCKFRHILESNNLMQIIFEELRGLLQEKKVMLKEGTIVDATIIEAPDSTKNKDKKPNSEMRLTKKGNKKYFGIKAHIGVDKESGLIHSVAVTAANVSDIEMANAVLHGEESEVRGDAGFIGIEKREEICEKYQDGSGRKEKQKPSHGKKRPDTLVKRQDVKFIINRKRSTVITEEEKAEERAKSRIRAIVEHSFCTLKHVFGFRRVRYRTVVKSTHQLLMLFALVNIYRCSQRKWNIK